MTGKPSHFQNLRIRLLMRNFTLRVERTWRTLKYEWVFLRDYQDYDQLERGLQVFVDFFNQERIHQGLDYQTPDEVYEQGTFPNIKENEVA